MKPQSDTQRALDRVAGARLAAAGPTALSTLNAFKAGDVQAVETDMKRRFASEIRQDRFKVAAPSLDGAEAIQQGRNNLLPVSFLSLGLRVSRAVARIQVPAIDQVGSGFLCAPGLFITNHHVLPSVQSAQEAFIEFDVTSEDWVKPSLFRLDPNHCFITSPVDALDFSIVAVGPALDSFQSLSSFGFCPLSDTDHKHAIGEFANIIQHPNGLEKKIAIQDNLIAARTDMSGIEQSVLHYFADTEQGSSGSPVFNNAWEVIALHHWGRAMRDLDPDASFTPDSVNQGIRISRIVRHLRDGLDHYDSTSKTLIRRLLELGRTQTPFRTAAPLQGVAPPLHGIMSEPMGQGLGGDESRNDILETKSSSGVTIPITLEISITGDAVGKVAPTSPLSVPTRREGAEAGLPKTGAGYRSDFLDHNRVELPRLRGRRKETISPLLDPDQYPTAGPGELQFTHFSVVMHKGRRLPWFGACNVDGGLLFGINSKRKMYRYPDRDIGIFEAQDAEGGYSWRWDRRIPKDHQTLNGWYTGTNTLVPRAGTDDAERYVAIGDFDRGHMVRRTEPIWGEPEAGQAANYQTFNVVNAAPQDPIFNRDQTRDPATLSPGEEARSWYGMEVAILRVATNEDRKFNVFTGPVFDDDDPFYASGKAGLPDCQVPLAFWKVVVWEEGRTLKSLAMIASQRWMLRRDAGGAESLTQSEELFRLRDFLTKVSTLERKTGVNFGTDVREADVLGSLHARRLRRMSLAAFRDHIAGQAQV